MQRPRGSKHGDDMVWFTKSDLSGCAAENGVRGPRIEAGRRGELRGCSRSKVVVA